MAQKHKLKNQAVLIVFFLSLIAFVALTLPVSLAQSAIEVENQPTLLRIIREFSFFINIILIILIIFLAITLYETVKNLGIEKGFAKKIKAVLLALHKEPSDVFSNKSKRDKRGTFEGSYHKYKKYHGLTQATLRKTVALLIIQIVILIVLIFGLAGFNHKGQAMEPGVYHGDNFQIEEIQ